VHKCTVSSSGTIPHHNKNRPFGSRFLLPTPHVYHFLLVVFSGYSPSAKISSQARICEPRCINAPCPHRTPSPTITKTDPLGVGFCFRLHKLMTIMKIESGYSPSAKISSQARICEPRCINAPCPHRTPSPTITKTDPLGVGFCRFLPA